MSLPAKVQALVDKGIAIVQQNDSHQLSPFLRRQIYDALNSADVSIGKYARKWLEILTVRFVLPIWQEEKLWGTWDNYPQPAQLIKIREDRLLGVLDSVYSTHDESLAAEMVSLTGEDKSSPIYPTWCVFEAAVYSYFHWDFEPEEQLTDYELISSYREGDLAHLALIAYAGRIQTEIAKREELKRIWENWYYEDNQATPLPWTLTLDTAACLTFWEWWLTKAVPEAWRLATDQKNMLPTSADRLIHLKDRTFLMSDCTVLYDDDDRITLLCGSDSHEETFIGEDVWLVSEWLDEDYRRLAQYEQSNHLMLSGETRPKPKHRLLDIGTQATSEGGDAPF